MSDLDDPRYLVPPVERAARLLRHIAEGDGAVNLAQTARAVGINRTTLTRLLRTLERERFIEPRADGMGYRIGLGLIGLAAHAFQSDDLVQVAVPVLARLAEMVGLSAHLGMLDGTAVVYLVRRTPNLPLASAVRVGSRLPAHATTMGRVLLAQLPPAVVAGLYAAPGALPRVTPHTPGTLAELAARLAEDRAAGLAWSDAFYEPGISSVAAAVFDAAGAPIAALNISGPEAAFATPQRARLGAAVREAAAEVSGRLGWAGRPAGALLVAAA